MVMEVAEVESVEEEIEIPYRPDESLVEETPNFVELFEKEEEEHEAALFEYEESEPDLPIETDPDMSAIDEERLVTGQYRRLEELNSQIMPDPEDVEPEKETAVIRKRTAQALKWVEEGAGGIFGEGSKLSQSMKSALHTMDLEDSESAQTTLNTVYNITEFFQTLPEQTLDVAGKIVDNFINVAGLLSTTVATAGAVPFEEFRYFDEQIPDNDNPITNLMKGMAEWYGGYKIGLTAMGKGASAIGGAKEVFMLSPLATFLTTDSDKDDLATIFKDTPYLGKFAVLYQEAGLGQEEDDPAIVKRFKQTLEEELVGLGFLGIFKALGVGKQTVSNLADMIIYRLQLIGLRRKIRKLQSFTGDETGSLLNKDNKFEPDPDLLNESELGEGFGDTVMPKVRKAADELNNPAAVDDKQIQQELGDALNALDEHVNPDHKPPRNFDGSNSYKKSPYTEEEIIDPASKVFHKDYVAIRKKLIQQATRKLKHRQVTLKKKADQKKADKEWKENASKADPEDAHVTFSEEVPGRYAKGNDGNYFTITPEGIKISAQGFRSVKDFNKAVKEFINTKEFENAWDGKFGRDIELERRGKVSDKVVQDFTWGRDPNEILDILRSRRIGEPITNENLVGGLLVVRRHADDLMTQIFDTIKRGGQDGLYSDKISDNEKIALAQQVEDLLDNIIPSLLGAVSEMGRGLRGWRVAGGVNLRRDSKYTHEMINSLGGRGNINEFLHAFAQGIKDGGLGKAIGQSTGMGLHPLKRIGNTFITLRANNLVTSSLSLTGNFVSGIFMTGYHHANMVLRPLVSALSGKYGKEHHGNIVDWYGMAYGYIPSVYEVIKTIGRSGANFFSKHPVSQIDPAFSKVKGVLDNKTFLDNRPKELQDAILESKSYVKGYMKYFSNRKFDASMHLMADSFEQFAKYVTFNWAGFRGQMLNDDMFKAYLSTMHIHAIAARKTSLKLKANPSQPLGTWHYEFKKLVENPTDAMVREAMFEARKATFTLPIFKDMAPIATQVYNLARSPNHPYAIKFMSQMIAPFITPTLNTARAAIESNLVTGRAFRAIRGVKLNPAQKEMRLAGEINGTMMFAYLVNSHFDNDWAVADVKGDPALTDMRKQHGHGPQDNTVLIPQRINDRESVVKQINVERYDIAGRIVIMSKRIAEIAKHDGIKAGELVIDSMVTLGEFMNLDFLHDLMSVAKDLSSFSGMDAKSRDHMLRKWGHATAKNITHALVPMYSLMYEQRKNADPRVLQTLIGLETTDLKKFSKRNKENLENDLNGHLKNIWSMDKKWYQGIEMAEMIVRNVYAGLPTLSEEVPGYPDMWANAASVPRHMKPFGEFTFEMPDFITQLMNSVNSFYDGKEIVFPRGRKISFSWRGPEYTYGPNPEWVKEQGGGELGDLVIDHPDKLDMLADDLVAATRKEFPKYPKTDERMKKEVRIYLELEGLRQLDQKHLDIVQGKDWTGYSNTTSKINPFKPSERIPIRGGAGLKDFITLRPEDYFNLIRIMNRDDLIEGKGSYLEEMYAILESDYKETNENAMGRYKYLRDVYKEYRDAAVEKFQDLYPSLFLSSGPDELEREETFKNILEL